MVRGAKLLTLNNRGIIFIALILATHFTVFLISKELLDVQVTEHIKKHIERNIEHGWFSEEKVEADEPSIRSYIKEFNKLSSAKDFAINNHIQLIIPNKIIICALDSITSEGKGLERSALESCDTSLQQTNAYIQGKERPLHFYYEWHFSKLALAIIFSLLLSALIFFLKAKYSR